MFCGYGVRVLWNPFFCHSYLDLSHDFHAQLCFRSHFSFTLRIHLLAVEMSDRQVFRSKASQIAVTDPNRTRVTAHVILKVREEDAVNDVLFAPLTNYREGASKPTGISNKTISGIKADSENAVLAPRKP